jgi:hypothetical protein
MKMTTAPKLSALSLFRHEGGAHTVRVIKADQAAQFASPDKPGLPAGAAAHVHKDAEIRMVGSGPDYCDLELACGCGNVTRFRCWNTEEKIATK